MMTTTKVTYRDSDTCPRCKEVGMIARGKTSTADPRYDDTAYVACVACGADLDENLNDLGTTYGD